MSQEHPTQDRIYFLECQEISLPDFRSGSDFPGSGYILDIGGGGEGIIGLLKGERVVAIDPLQSELEDAPNGPLKIVMDACQLKFLDNTFPTITAFFTFMFIPAADHAQVLSEAYRVLAPGGRMYLWDIALPTRLDPLKEIVAFRLTVKLPKEEISTGYGTRWPEQLQDLKYYQHLAWQAGFTILRCQEQDRQLFLELTKPEA